MVQLLVSTPSRSETNQKAYWRASVSVKNAYICLQYLGFDVIPQNCNIWCNIIEYIKQFSTMHAFLHCRYGLVVLWCTETSPHASSHLPTESTSCTRSTNSGRGGVGVLFQQGELALFVSVVDEFHMHFHFWETIPSIKRTENWWYLSSGPVSSADKTPRQHQSSWCGRHGRDQDEGLHIAF